MSYTTSPNMLLRVPAVGNDIGPDYAININFDLLSILDTHDHTSGKGVQITPAAININTSLPFNDNFATELSGLTLLAQSTTPALSTIYESGNDLFFVDGIGNNIRITQSGGVAGSPGSITNLVAPASANYVAGSQTFVWQSNINIAANMDAGAYLFRNLSPNSTFAITLQAPAALASNWTLTLPAIPVAQSFMTLNASGEMAAPWTVDDTTIKIVANQLVAQGQNIPNSSREHSWELNGTYPTLTFPLLNIDGPFLAPYNITINSVWIYSGTSGTSGTSEFDLKVKSPGGSYASILSTTGKFTAASTAISITRVSTTATATLTSHGFSNGTSVVISGATQTEYNGTFTVSNATANTFDYTVSGTPATPATGSPVVATPASDLYTDSGSVIPAKVGVTKPVLSTTAITAGQEIKWDLIQSMNTGATDARIRIYWTQT